MARVVSARTVPSMTTRTRRECGCSVMRGSLASSMIVPCVFFLIFFLRSVTVLEALADGRSPTTNVLPARAAPSGRASRASGGCLVFFLEGVLQRFALLVKELAVVGRLQAAFLLGGLFLLRLGDGTRIEGREDGHQDAQRGEHGEGIGIAEALHQAADHRRAGRLAERYRHEGQHR